mgnify:CR=1 FL=1
MSELSQEKTHKKLLDSVIDKFEALGFTQLTEIQKRAIPLVVQKKDSLIIAPTGSGKTECSVIPVFSFVSGSKDRKSTRLNSSHPSRSRMPSSA